MTPFWPLQPNTLDYISHWFGCFDDDELDKIVSIGNGKDLTPSFVNDANGNLSVDNQMRKSNVCFLPPTEIPFVYYRLTHVINELNKKCFNFDVTGFGEFLQFAEYKEGDFIHSHLDMGNTMIPRKLTLSVQLTDENDYEGGDIEVMTSAEHPLKLSRQRGAVLVFPSYIMHRVTPVTRGVRHSLVGWVTGPQFR